MCGRCTTCKGCGSGKGADVDTMRHGHKPYEVRGNDYAVNGPHDPASIVPPLTLHNPASNQAESGIVLHSAFGAALQRNKTRTVRQMPPIPYAHKFRGFIGAMIVQNAKQVPIVPVTGYEGILPMTQQPLIKKPLPYVGN